jgi:hypothetical protein
MFQRYARPRHREPHPYTTRPMDMTALPQARSRGATWRDRVAAAALVGLTSAALAACASAHSNAPSSGASVPPIVTSPASPPTESTAPPGTTSTGAPGTGTAGCPRNLVVPTADLTHSFCVANGGTVTILAPANQAQGWQPFDTTGNSLAAATGSPPVSGSGTILAVFKAVAPGSSVVSSAHRNCPVPSGGVGCNSILIWQVTITVK